MWLAGEAPGLCGNPRNLMAARYELELPHYPVERGLLEKHLDCGNPGNSIASYYYPPHTTAATTTRTHTRATYTQPDDEKPETKGRL